MKIIIRSLLTFLFLLLSTQTFSQQLIPFQARLTDGTGAPVADGVYSINFAIYDVATGGVPVNGWVESHVTTSVVGGVVNVILGSITPLNDPDNDGDLSDAVTFYTTDGNRFIGVTIGAGQEMVPRHQLVPSFHAATADSAATTDDAAKLGGNLPSYYTALSQHDADLVALNSQIDSKVASLMAGMISAFSTSCPTGWLLADGTSGTPDLRSRFLRGESSGNPSALDFGGNDNATVVAHSHAVDPPNTNATTDGNHRHNITTSDGGDPNGAFRPTAQEYDWDGIVYSEYAGDHNHSVDIPAFNSASVGSSATNANIPGYYEVIYCVKQ